MSSPCFAHVTTVATNAETQYQSRQIARQRTLKAATELGCKSKTFAAFDYEAHNDVFFTCEKGGQKIVLKAHLGDAIKLSTWPKPSQAALAARYNFAAPAYPVHSVFGVMASLFLSGEPLHEAALQKVDCEIVALRQKLHHAISPADARVVAHKIQGNYLKAHMTRLQNETRKTRLGPA